MRKRPLTAAFVARVKTPGRYGDGGLGLYLRVHRMKSGRVSKSWGQRIRVGGKPTNLGLGSYPVVTLREAREKALENRRAVHWGHDPRDAGVPTFEAAVDKVIAIHSPTWKDPFRMAGRWRQTLRDYADPRIGRKRVSEVATADVLAILKPIWSSKPATARAVHQRIGAVMKWAVAKGYRPDNPAGDAIAAALPRNGNAIRHHKALPHGEVAAALAEVRNSESHAGVRLALEFMVLTATRSNEVRGAACDEIERDVWTIPASHMKAKREHRVPLSRRALEILEEARKLLNDGGIVFRGAKGGRIHASMFSKLLRRLGIAGTSHGMRSSFRDWCSETGVAREVAEAALAHKVRSQTEAAYARSDLLDRRREVMQAWAAHPDRFVSGEPKPKPLPEAVWINPPTPSLTTQEIAL